MTVYRIPTKIENLAPLVLSANRSTLLTEGMDYIGGSVLRGILIEEYLNRHGDLGENAHTDAAFNRLFFGDTVFAPAFPSKNHETSFMLPRSLQISKDGKRFNDMLQNPDPDKEAGFKTKRGLGVMAGTNSSTDVKIDGVSVPKNICLHIGRGGENRLAGSSRDGSVFSYESMNAGQTFCGAIYGSQADLAELASAFPQRKFIGYAGKSKYTQYGKVCLTLAEPEPLKLPDLPSGDKICLRLATALVTEDIISEARQTLSEYFADLSDIKIGAVYGAKEEVTGFNNRWKMRPPDREALAAGTVFELIRAGGWDAASWQKLQKMCYLGIGSRTEEGYGQMRIWEPTPNLVPTDAHASDNIFCLRRPKGIIPFGNPIKGSRGNYFPLQGFGDRVPGNTVNSNEEIKSEEVKRVARLILLKRLTEAVKLRAWSDVQGIKNALEGKKHAMTRLIFLLGARQRLAELPQRFTGVMCGELLNDKGNPSPLAKKLQNIRLSGSDSRKHELSELLMDPTLIPEEALGHIPKDWQDFAAETGVATEKDGRCVLDDAEMRGGLFYDYWLWFFRHAAKIAATKEG